MQVVKYLDRISISMDTTDVDLAERVGRHRMDRVIENIRALSAVFPSIRITTVDFGQPLDCVREFVREIRATHYVQKLFKKPDYSVVYTLFPVPQLNYPTNLNYKCMGLASRMVAYNIKGVKMPCCYIKDTSVYPGYDEIIEIFNDRYNTIPPKCCVGCVKLQPVALSYK